MKNVYLVNLSFGLAGIERRFANLWHVLNRRGKVRPILVIPSALALLLQEVNLLPSESRAVIIIPEPRPLEWLGRLKLPSMFDMPRAILRSRIAALGYRRIWRIIKQDTASIVHIGMNCSALTPPHVPTVYECVDAGLEQFGTKHFRRASRRKCIVHCQTERIRTVLDSLYESQKPRWRTLTNPTYFANYEDSTGADCRDSRQVVFVGRFHPIKNPLLFIEAVALARKRGCDCRATMLGEGPLRPQIDALVKRLGLEPFVTITFEKRPTDTLRRATIYVSLQNGDNYGSQALLEAMGAGCAIIASDLGETWKIITEEVGVRVSLTVESVASAIERLVESPERTRKLGVSAEQVARTKYSADIYASFLESTYTLSDKFYRGVDSSGKITDSIDSNYQA